MIWSSRLASAGLAALIASLAAYVAMCIAFAIMDVNGVAFAVDALVWPFLGMIAGAAMVLAGAWMESRQ